MKGFAKVICLLIFICAAGVPFAEGEKGPGQVTITYVLHKIPKIASNQIAVWVEDESGNYVKTLFATRFTAGGGYKRRPVALPQWVNVADWPNASKAEVDAVSGATQKAGSIELVWDCTGRDGKPVVPGTYVYKIEGNIYWDNRVLWMGRIAVGGAPGTSQAEATYLPPDGAEKEVLLEMVKAVYKP
jgi:hypothetical protein